MSKNRIFVDSIVHFRGRRNESSSEISAHGIYRSVKLFSPANQIARNKYIDEELELYNDDSDRFNIVKCH